MADILIRGMEMPKNCMACPLRDRDDDHCNLLPESVNMDTFDYQRQHCPLVPLPEGHGRLGDLDEARKRWLNGEEDVLLNAPTIVPAEGGTDDAPTSD